MDKSKAGPARRGRPPLDRQKIRKNRVVTFLTDDEFKQLQALGLDPSSIICPIGLPGIEGKEPSVIAASVAAELLIVHSQLALGRVSRLDA